MQVIIQSPRFRIKEELNQLIQDKVSHFERINKRITKCEVLLKKENDDRKEDCFIEIQLKVPGQKLFAQETGENFEGTLHKVVNDLESQLRRIKTKEENV